MREEVADTLTFSSDEEVLEVDGVGPTDGDGGAGGLSRRTYFVATGEGNEYGSRIRASHSF